MSEQDEGLERSPAKGTQSGGSPPDYIPALRFGWLTSLYDPIVAWTAREDTFKRRLLREARIEAGFSILDLGCGTATLTILAKRKHPDSKVTGIDGDERVLAIARRKLTKAGLDVSLDLGLAGELPYPDESFDRVLSSLLFHHLTRDQKKSALIEAFRVLRTGGELHVADWGQAQNLIERTAFLSVQMLDGFKTTTDNVKGRLLRMFVQAGFGDVSERVRFRTVFGVISLYRAVKPAG